MIDVEQVHPATFESFYRTEYAAGVRLARLLTTSADVAEDLTQEAFLRMHARFATVTNPRAYLRTAIVNLCRSWHRRQRRTERQAHLLLVDYDVPLGATEVLDAIDALPWNWKAVVVLRYWADLSEAEIADALGCAPGTVKTWSARALARLERVLPS